MMFKSLIGPQYCYKVKKLNIVFKEFLLILCILLVLPTTENYKFLKKFLISAAHYFSSFFNAFHNYNYFLSYFLIKTLKIKIILHLNLFLFYTENSTKWR